MKTLSSFVAFFVLGASLHAGVGLSIQYSEYYTETKDGGVQLAPYSSVASAASLFPDAPGDPEDTAGAVALYRPDGTLTPIWYIWNSPWGASYQWTDFFSSLDNAQLGTYTFAFSGGTRDGTISTLTLDPKCIPPAVPQLTDHSFDLLTSGDVTKPIRLVIRPWYLPTAEMPTVTPTKPYVCWTAINIIADNGENPVFTLCDPRTTSLVIPANALKPGTKYYFQMDYEVETHDMRVRYLRTLYLQFTTAGTAPQHTAAG